MKFHKFFIQEIKEEVEDTYIIKATIEGENNNLAFMPGQYCFIVNPKYTRPFEPHPFSIASSPFEEGYLEFCVKVYGNWTKEFCKKKKGDEVYISSSFGRFIWNPSIENAVFLIGGIGISPVMSMLRFIEHSNSKPSSITVLYGNRNPATIAYKKELAEIKRKVPGLKVINIFSEVEKEVENGYRGFITEEIIRNEVELSDQPTFFVVGPPVFIEKMKKTLDELRIHKKNIKEELLDLQYNLPHQL